MYVSLSTQCYDSLSLSALLLLRRRPLSLSLSVVRCSLSAAAFGQWETLIRATIRAKRNDMVCVCVWRERETETERERERERETGRARVYVCVMKALAIFLLIDAASK